MKVYDITLTCDHQMLVMAPDERVARIAAVDEAARHRVLVEKIEEVDMSTSGLLAWYPGPFSQDAIADEEES